MLLLGLLFIVGAAAVTAGVLYDGGEDANVEMFGTTINTTIAGVFGVGLLAGLVFLLGIWMIVAGAARSRRKRLERREARARHRDSVAEMEEERARLRAENEQLQERLARGGGTTATPGQPGTGPATRPATRPSDAPETTGMPWRSNDPEAPETIDTEAGRRREGV